MRRRALTDGYVRDQRRHPPDLTAVSAPTLQLCAIPTPRTEYPWLRSGTADYRQAAEYVRQILVPFNRSLCARFATLVPAGHTREITGSHYVFFTQPSLAAAAIREFLFAELPR